jgi:hypothetical protein
MAVSILAPDTRIGSLGNGLPYGILDLLVLRLDRGTAGGRLQQDFVSFAAYGLLLYRAKSAFAPGAHFFFRVATVRRSAASLSILRLGTCI